MKNIVTLSFLVLLLTTSFAGAMATGESPKCEKCGMDRTAFAHSRMVVIYADGTTVGTCSLHCAAEELRQNRDKPVRSLMVADYSTKELVDAGSATWVVGGKRHGVMTALAKWAFAKTEGARSFVSENGGEVTPFDQALKAATLEILAQAAEEREVAGEMLREQQTGVAVHRALPE
jgi:nitrous oxide reductase accessory protein NosL